MCCFLLGSSLGTITAPANWNDAGLTSNGRVYWKYVVSGEAASFQFSQTGTASGWAAIMQAFSNTAPANPITIVNNQENAATSASADAPFSAKSGLDTTGLVIAAARFRNTSAQPTITTPSLDPWAQIIEQTYQAGTNWNGNELAYINPSSGSLQSDVWHSNFSTGGGVFPSTHSISIAANAPPAAPVGLVASGFYE